RDVLEEHQPQDHVLVLARIHGAAQLIGRLPQRVLELLHRGGRARRGHVLLFSSGHCTPHSVSGGRPPLSSFPTRTTPAATPAVSSALSLLNTRARARSSTCARSICPNASASCGARPSGTRRTCH